MEKIKIGKRKELYEIESIIQHAPNILRIIFPEGTKIPEKWDGDISICTAGGIPYAVKSEYKTVYLQESQTVYLSNDGSVYVPPVLPEPVPEPEPYVKTLDEVKAAKKAEISVICEQVIYSGVDVTLTDGELHHFSLTEKDQLNLFRKQIQMVASTEQVEYHADGQPFRYYSAADMQDIIEAAVWYVSYHTTYCNALNMWIAGCESAEEVGQIFYGADVPKEYRSEVLQAYLIQIAEMTSKREEDKESNLSI